MASAQIILYAGLLIIGFGAIMWALKPATPTAANTLKFMGLELSLNTPAIAVMAIGVVLVVVSTKLPVSADDPHTGSGPSQIFTLGSPPAGIERDAANEAILIGIFYQTARFADAEKVASALNAAGFRLVHYEVLLDNVIYSGPRTPNLVLVKSIDDFKEKRAAVRELVLKALPDRQPVDVVLPSNSLVYAAGQPSDRGVIQVDLF